MLESAEHRDITLLEIANLCRETAQELRDSSPDHPFAPPHHPHLNGGGVASGGGMDSGFGADGDHLDPHAEEGGEEEGTSGKGLNGHKVGVVSVVR